MLATSLLLELALFLLTDSAGTIVNNAEIQGADKKTIAVTSYDGIFSYNFADKHDKADVTIIATGYDTLDVTIKPSETMQRICLKRSKRHYEANIEPHYGKSVKLRGAKSRDEKEAIEIMYALDEAAPMLYESKAVGREPSVEAAMVESDVTAVYSHVPAAGMNLPSAGKLTAGEVNDFAKWYFWEKVINGSHKQHSGTWGLRPTERYRVTVTNKENYPIVDIPVELLSASGDVLYSGRTDNTGSAELWANHNISDAQRKKDAATRVRCRYNESIVELPEAKPFPEVNRFVVDAPCEAPKAVEVFFVADATGSMGDELKYLKAEMLDVIKRSGKAAPDAEIRTGALVYRDHGDEYINRISPLDSEISVTQRFLEQQYASGGGDYPEAVPEALMAAVNSADWSKRARARIVFLILDAPCHEDSATVAMLRKQVAEAAKSGVRVVPVVCSGLDESGELLMRSIALLTNGTSFFLTDDSGIGDTHLKPTTDSLKVEHLNDMLVRTIIEFSVVPDCADEWADEALAEEETDAFVPNPFSTEDLDSLPSLLPQMATEDVLRVNPNPCKDYCLVDLPQGAEALYLVDLSGKTIKMLGAFAAPTTGYTLSTGMLPKGVYFVKAFVGGRWYTRKLIVNS